MKIVKSGCMRRDCPVCSDQVGRRRAKRVKERLLLGIQERQGLRHICRTTFTVPPAQRRKFQDRKTWRAALKLIWKFMQSDLGAVYGVEFSHPHGEDEGVFHPHANFLWIRTPGRSGLLAEKQLEDLKAEWGRIIGSTQKVNVQHKYRPMNDSRGVGHMVKYNARNFPGFSAWLGSMRWYGKFPRIPKKKGEGAWCCPDCHEPFLFLGRAIESEYFEYVEKLKLHYREQHEGGP